MQLNQSEMARQGSWLLLALAAASFIWTQAAIWPVNGFWTDDLYSIHSADPALPFLQLFSERIITDTNPPLYYSLLHIALNLQPNARIAALALNCLGLVLGAWWILRLFTEHGRPIEGRVMAAVLIACGPVIAFAPEVRAYCLAMIASAALAMHAALALEHPDHKSLRAMVVLAALAVLLHMFGAFFAGATAAALVIMGWALKREDLWRRGLVLGGASLAVAALWLAFAYPQFIRAAGGNFWIKFDLDTIVGTIWYLRELTMRWNVVAVLMIAAFVGLLLARPSRTLMLTTVVLLRAFVAVPTLISLHSPMIYGRYLAVGAPAALMLFTMGLVAMIKATPLQRRDQAIAAMATVSLAGAAFGGGLSAPEIVASKQIYRGAPVVAEALNTCASPSVRVAGGLQFWWSFPLALGRDDVAIMPAPLSPTADVIAAPCDVVAWGEHTLFDPLSASDDALLADANLTNRNGVVLEFHRFPSSYVILRQD